MTPQEYWNRLNQARGIVLQNKSADGNCLVMDHNQTPFEIPDPEEIEDEVREHICEYLLKHLNEYLPK